MDKTTYSIQFDKTKIKAMRLDQFLQQKFNLPSRTKAQDLIRQGLVFLNMNGNEQVLKKTGFEVTNEIEKYIFIQTNEYMKYVSRAGLKLEFAIKEFKINVEGMVVLDVGQSTGGFTDCLLKMNATKIVGIDVGVNQLHESLRNNSKVIFFENLNVKELDKNELFLKSIPLNLFDMIVMDVSFISLTKVIPIIEKYLNTNGHFIFLIKPQFECGSTNLDSNGIVIPTYNLDMLLQNLKSNIDQTFFCSSRIISSILKGKDGNQEYLVYGKKNDSKVI